MKRVFAATCFAVACAVALAAQAPYDPQAQRKPTPASEEKSVSVTGCLKAGDTADTFVLTNAKADAPAATEKPGTVPTTPAIPENATLRLIGAPASLDLKNHVGHTVQLTGMIVPQGPKATPPAGTTGTTPPTATPPPAAPTPTPTPPAATPPMATPPTVPPTQTLNVKAMKHIAGTCPAK